MSTQDTPASESNSNNYDTFSHSSAEALASAAGINDRTATRLFNVAAMNGTNEAIIELDTEKGRWLVDKLTGVSTNAVIARAQADGPDGVLVQNAAPASKVSYAIGQMQRARQKHNDTGDDTYAELAHQYYHAAHSRVRLPAVADDDDLSDEVYFGVHPSGQSNEIGEWLPKQHITAIHRISPPARRDECFVVAKQDDTIQAARGTRDNIDVFVGLECEPYVGSNRDGDEYTQRKLEIDADPDYRPVMRALYEPTYTTYEDDLKRWRATFSDLENILDHLAANDIVVGIHPVTVKAASTELGISLTDIYHKNGGKSVSEATTFELVEDETSTDDETESFEELSSLDDLPEMDDINSDSPASDTDSTNDNEQSEPAETDNADTSDTDTSEQTPEPEDTKTDSEDSDTTESNTSDETDDAEEEPDEEEIMDEFEDLLD